MFLFEIKLAPTISLDNTDAGRYNPRAALSQFRRIKSPHRNNIRAPKRDAAADDAGATLIGNLVYGDAGHRM